MSDEQGFTEICSMLGIVTIYIMHFIYIHTHCMVVFYMDVQSDMHKLVPAIQKTDNFSCKVHKICTFTTHRTLDSTVEAHYDESQGKLETSLSIRNSFQPVGSFRMKQMSYIYSFQENHCKSLPYNELMLRVRYRACMCDCNVMQCDCNVMQCDAM